MLRFPRWACSGCVQFKQHITGCRGETVHPIYKRIGTGNCGAPFVRKPYVIGVWVSLAQHGHQSLLYNIKGFRRCASHDHCYPKAGYWASCVWCLCCGQQRVRKYRVERLQCPNCAQQPVADCPGGIEQPRVDVHNPPAPEVRPCAGQHNDGKRDGGELARIAQRNKRRCPHDGCSGNQQQSQRVKSVISCYLSPRDFNGQETMKLKNRQMTSFPVVSPLNERKKSVTAS